MNMFYHIASEISVIFRLIRSPSSLAFWAPTQGHLIYHRRTPNKPSDLHVPPKDGNTQDMFMHLLSKMTDGKDGHRKGNHVYTRCPEFILTFEPIEYPAAEASLSEAELFPQSCFQRTLGVISRTDDISGISCSLLVQRVVPRQEIELRF